MNKHKPKHHVVGCSVYVGRVEVARFNTTHQAQSFVKFIADKQKGENNENIGK